MVVVDSGGQPRPLHSTIEQQLANYEVYAVPMESNRVLTTSARQSLATGTPAAPAYRALGKAQYGRSDFTAPSVSYNQLGTRTSAGNGGAGDGYLVIATGGDGSETTTYAVPSCAPPGAAALHTVPAYRALGKARYGRSDFTAPSVPYDRRCSANDGANPATDGATNPRMTYEVAGADSASLPYGVRNNDVHGRQGRGARMPSNADTEALPAKPLLALAPPGEAGSPCHLAPNMQGCVAHPGQKNAAVTGAESTPTPTSTGPARRGLQRVDSFC